MRTILAVAAALVALAACDSAAGGAMPYSAKPDECGTQSETGARCCTWSHEFKGVGCSDVWCDNGGEWEPSGDACGTPYTAEPDGCGEYTLGGNEATECCTYTTGEGCEGVEMWCKSEGSAFSEAGWHGPATCEEMAAITPAP